MSKKVFVSIIEQTSNISVNCDKCNLEISIEIETSDASEDLYKFLIEDIHKRIDKHNCEPRTTKGY